MFGELGEPYI